LIPVRDSAPRHGVPFVNHALIAACTFVFGWELFGGANLDAVVEHYGLVPARFVALWERHGPFSVQLWMPFVSSAFLHGGLSHFAFNMLFLWVFGDNVEDRFGHLRYAAFYLAGAVFAGAAHLLAHPESVTPTIGASGAIAAVMGAYFLLYPRAWITSVLLPFFWIRFRVPALLYLAVWFAIQLARGQAALEGEASAAGVAWWAHAGGFVFGALAILVLGRRGGRMPVVP
jgi:membrane associated rhomboid family serine protease